MEASAGLVAGSHNRNELVLIRGHEEVGRSRHTLATRVLACCVNVFFDGFGDFVVGDVAAEAVEGAQWSGV